MMKYKAVFIPVFGSSTVFSSREVFTFNEAKLVLDSIANYTLLLHEKYIMPDHSNVGWVEKFEDGEWVEVDEDD